LAELEYELRDDAVLYTLGGGLRIKVQRKSPARVRVMMQRGEVIVPPETGDLGTSGFRNKLVDLAHERLGEDAGLADDLGLIAVGFDEHLMEREVAAAKHDEETNAPELVSTPYRIVDGGFARLVNTREGEIAQRFTNFIAWVEEEVVKDDGAEAKRVFRLAGEARGRLLPKVDVPAARFGAMNWISDGWGLTAVIAAGPAARDCTREVIELYSSGAPIRYVFAHTGWRELPGGQLAYLHDGGAVGAEGVGVEVELEPGLERYALPASFTSEELAGAVRQSLSFLELAPIRITAPLLGAAYLAPLVEIIVPDFVVWLYGPTGSLKSTLAALALSHFGDFSETRLPLSFESTANALERLLFLLKDTLAVVDDWRPAVSRSEASELDRKAQRLLRGVGNRTGRGRMTSDTTLRHSYPPRGMVVATAEALPEGPAFQSAAARAISLNLSPEDVSLECLSGLQQSKAALPRAMTGYLGWIAPRYEDLSRELPARREALRDEVRSRLAGAHPRTPDAVASTIVGLQVLRDFAMDVGALDAQEGEEFLERASAGVIEAGAAHADATRGGDPATRFIEILRSLFAAGKAYVRDKETGGQPPLCEELGWEEDTYYGGYQPNRNADFVGWADEEYIYLDQDTAYAAVAAFAQRGAIPFGVKPRAVWEGLKRARLSLTDTNRNATTAWICGGSKRVVQLALSIIVERGDDAD
jgi:hypothetical protein